MATKRWVGGTTAVAQVDRFTPATVEVGDVFTLTATGEDGSTAAVSFTATGTTVANVTAGLVAAWNASGNPLHTPITAADATTSLTLTADTAGVAFSVASSTTDGGGANTQTLVRAAVTANRGPNDWSTADNWSDYTVPVNSDTVVIDGRSTYAITRSLNQSAVTLARLTIVKGSPAIGTTSAPLRVSATILDVNVAPTDGSNPAGAATINLDTGSVTTTCTVYDSRNTGADGVEPVVWKGADASNVVRVLGGNVGIGTGKPGDTATLPTLQVLGNATVRVGSGVTLTTLVQQAGEVTLECAATTVNQDGGKLTTKGTGAITTVYASGTFASNSTGTITTLYVEPGGVADFTGNAAARTVSNAFINGSGRINAALPTVAGAAHAVTFTNGVDCIRGAKSGQVDFGGDITVTPSAT